MNDESPTEKALRLLKEQLDELLTVGTLNHKDAKFKSWRDTTAKTLVAFLGPKSRYSTRFSSIAFSGAVSTRPWSSRSPDYVSQQDMFAFRRGCELAELALRAAIQAIQDTGLPESEPARTAGDGSAQVSQNSQASASTEKQVNAIGGTKKGEQIPEGAVRCLEQIASILEQSEELTRRELKEAQAHVEAIALEVQKTEGTRDWKLLLERGQSLLDLAAKATDKAKLLALHTSVIRSMIDHAKEALESG
jgi:hypothetical protein